MSSDAHAWDRLAAGIRDVLPEWAEYAGYGTYALAGYLWAAVLAGVAVGIYVNGYDTAAWLAIALAAFAWLLGSYYRGAAKVRLTCDHCGADARGESFCPECGEVTYNGGNE